MDLAPDLPFVTPELEGTGGTLKLSPAHFVVEEIPLYEPCGEGGHVYLTIRREGLNTRDVQRALANVFELRERDVGCAGQKDKVARTTQTFSLPLVSGAAEDVAARAAGETGLEVLAVRRHKNKLGRGHLAGNRFEILVDGVAPAALAPDALERAQAIVARLEERGMANYFGEQRLGPGGRAARRGRRRLDGSDGSPISHGQWIAKMELSAWQASLFNAWICERMHRACFDRVMTGDLARKEDTGGLFEVVDEAVEQARFRRREISATGPIYGAKMRWPGGSPLDLEREVFEASGVDPSALTKARLPGSRRPARVFLRDVALELRTEGLRLAFRLPKGAFATIALREIMKS